MLIAAITVKNCTLAFSEYVTDVAFVWFVKQVPNMPDMKQLMEWTHRLRESADANVIY